MPDLDQIEARLRRLEDIEAIKSLKARYCYYCDDGYDADALAELFVPDGVWDGGLLGRAEGREKIRTFFVNARDAVSFAVHMVLNPLIEIEGDEARGTWYLFQALTSAPQERAMWGSARYDEQYVRTPEGWKFRRLELVSFFWTPFEAGWVKERFVALGSGGRGAAGGSER